MGASIANEAFQVSEAVKGKVGAQWLGRVLTSMLTIGR